MLARAAFPAFFLSLGGFILLLLVTLSVPIIKTIYLLQVRIKQGNSIGSTSLGANAGVFGLCYQGGQASILGFEYSSNAGCTDPHVGYTFDENLLGLSNSGLSKAVIKGVAGALILNAIAAGLAGLSLIWSFFAWLCSSRGWEIFTFVSLFFAVISAWLAWALDLALALVARHRIEDASNDVLDARIGNGVWIALGGAVALTLALCFAGCGMFGRFGNERNPTHKPVSYRRRHFWQRDQTGRGTY
ncbi:uncharacterized protein I206_102483 [Kwoniella pini CBS 10737]|uniref:Pali-domain-containing protein n=1 Tax=Kwoniella pini CBS 10737 TaxID=1296096 RepID=A0A1B9I5I5_9TREE|nr:uncharacterized protein I206_02834 [Kwoniella pini CBS 10737]OCF50778.1 hypothetical protein I206_02834 [Kwoniella pini CBS 10737]